MSEPLTNERRPFHRSQPRNWWAQKPYRAYTLRELSGVAVAIYGLVLFAGLVCLSLGPGTFALYRQFLTGPLSLVLHTVLLAAVLWHVVTWFQILPKTMPKLILGGEPVPQRRVTAIALLGALSCSLALLAAVIVFGAMS